MEKRQAPEKESSEPNIYYLDLQAYIGATKHMGGLEATKDLIKLCHIRREAYILDVGCGVGATACYLAKQYGCQVVGVDIREMMIERATERAKAAKVDSKVIFRVADAQQLPFDDGMFDTTICESVATFIKDKPGVVRQCARVTKNGGYVGFNEEVWVKTPPTKEYMEFMRNKMDVEPNIPLISDWERYLTEAGLQDIVVCVYDKFDTKREWSQKKRYSFMDYLLIINRTLRLYAKNGAYRKYMKESKQRPKRLFEHLGYGLMAGMKK
jgi:arsenite methyltransferase